ncbi:acetyltransferase [Vagococcus fluvialis]|uniref:acetyltransferase n=1 Tax=Vagococcus fluvialis TaxID=2738 RepID=UPI0028921A2A|nr:acetyltransferase [Vagococcus fluvialis]MDT2782437.1 acetyltransferase [Vagococcus fluvialis]
MKKLIIIGAGGHGKVCAEIAQDMEKWDEICFLDDAFPTIKECLGLSVLGVVDNIELYKDYDFFVAIGNNKLRSKYIDLILINKKNLVTLIHPTAYISRYAMIGLGTSIHQFSVVNTESKIGIGCIINTGSIIEHEIIIGDFVHISPNVSIGGQCRIGQNTWVGIGTTILNNKYITENVVLGGHSLVIKNIDNSGIYKGLIK